MNRILLIAIFLTFLLCWVDGDDDEKRCTGGEAAGMEEGCVVIEKTKLIFTGEFEDEDFLREKMATIRRIESGVEVAGIIYEVFDFLNHVKEIKNPHGPALVFSDNKKLKSIQMGNLKLLAGKEEDVLFDNDNFPIEVYENPEALKEMLHLEATARASHNGAKCSEDFIRITVAELDGYGWFLYIFIVLCVVMAILASLQTYYLLRARGVIGNKNGSRKNKKGSKSGKMSKSVRESGGKEDDKLQ